MDWRTFKIRVVLVVAVTFVSGLQTGVGAAPREGGQIVISLRSTCQVDGDDVLISDIARVDTADQTLKSLIEGLDVGQAPAGEGSILVSAKVVEFRLRLAGVDVRRVSIRGSKTEVLGYGASFATRAVASDTNNHSVVQSSSRSVRAPQNSSQPQGPRKPKGEARGSASGDQAAHSPEDAILAAARKAILDQLPWSEEDVTFQLAQSIARELNANGGLADARCDAHVRSTGGPPLGRVNVDVTVSSDTRSPVVVPVSFDVRHFDNVVATARPIARGRKIQSDDVCLHRCDVTTSADYCTRVDQMVGRVAARPLTALQTIREQDLERNAGSSTGSDQAVVIKRQDRVAMVAKVGDLNISVRGEALQDGRIGQTIRVQNVESKSIVQGRVLSAEEVEISY